MIRPGQELWFQKDGRVLQVIVTSEERRGFHAVLMTNTELPESMLNDVAQPSELFDAELAAVDSAIGWLSARLVSLKYRENLLKKP